MFVTKTPLNCFALLTFLPTNVTVLEAVEGSTRARSEAGVEGDSRAGTAQKMSKAVAKNQP